MTYIKLKNRIQLFENLFKDKRLRYLESNELLNLAHRFSKIDKKPGYVMKFNENNSTINLIREKLYQLLNQK